MSYAESQTRRAKTKISRSGPGRRQAGEPKIDREIILRRGIELARSVSLTAISNVRVAAEFNVTAATIRYHLRGRGTLLTGIIELFFEGLHGRLPPRTGEWQADLVAAAEVTYREYLRYPGITSYFAAENRFHIFAVATQTSSASLMFLERYLAIIRDTGVNPERGSAYAIMLLHLVHMAAHTTANHRWPGEQKLLVKRLKALDPNAFPNIVAMRDGYLKFAGDPAFTMAIELILFNLKLESRP